MEKERSKQKKMSNAILRNSIIWGSIYFLFSAGLRSNGVVDMLYLILMQFMPGITFPFSTTFFIINRDDSKKIRNYFHLIGSVAIYYSSICIISGGSQLEYIAMIAGFFGSFSYLVITKYLILDSLEWKQIFLTALISGIGFGLVILMPVELGGVGLGMSILVWTIINGRLMNSEIKKYYGQMNLEQQ